MLKAGSGAEYLLTLSDLPEVGHAYRYALVQDGQGHLLRTLGEDAMGETEEFAGLLHLNAVARAIVEAAPRPLFTLVVPRGFGQLGRR
jgi:hypothetical protein